MVEKIREIKQSTAIGQNPVSAFAAADQMMQQGTPSSTSCAIGLAWPIRTG